MIVLSRPYPDISALLFNKASLNLFDLEFYPLGRHALLSGLIKMGVKKGDTIIVIGFININTRASNGAVSYDVYIAIQIKICIAVSRGISIVF